MENLKEIVLYSENITNSLKDDLISFANKIGYANIKDIHCRMDNRFIEFVKEYIQINEDVDINSFIEIKRVDINKKWTIIYKSKYIKENSSTLKENIAYLNNYYQEYNYLQFQDI